MIYLLGDLQLPDAAVLETVRGLTLDPAAYTDWEAGLSPFSGCAYPATLAVIVPHERKHGFAVGVCYEGARLRLRAALPDKRFGVSSSFVLLAREAAKRGATGALHVLESKRRVGHVLTLAQGDAPWRRLGETELAAALAGPEVSALDAVLAQKSLPPNDEGAASAPKKATATSPPRARGAAAELGLRDISELAHASLDEPRSARSTPLPEAVLRAEETAIRALESAAPEAVLAAARRLPEGLEVYRRAGRGGEPLAASVAFTTGEELVTALREATRGPHPVWGRSLQGLAFSLLGELGHRDAEALGREAFFAAAPEAYRARAAWGLRGSRADDVLEAFIALVVGETKAPSSVREMVAVALGVSPHPRAPALLSQALTRLLAERPAHHASRGAKLTRALGAQRARAAVPLLLPLWKGRDAELREAAGEALLAIGETSGLTALAEKTSARDDVVKALAVAGAIRLDPLAAHGAFSATFAKDFAKNHTAYLDTSLIFGALEKVSRLAPEVRTAVVEDGRWLRSAEALIPTLAGDEVASLLATLRPPGAARLLVEHLPHFQPERAAEALLALADRSVAPALELAVAQLKRKSDRRTFEPVLRALSAPEESR